MVLERNVGVVVKRLQACPLPLGGGGGSVRNISAVRRTLGRKELDVLRNDVHARALNALAVNLIANLNRAADCDLVALFGVSRHGLT